MTRQITAAVVLGCLGVLAPLGCHSMPGGKNSGPVPPLGTNTTGESRSNAKLPPKETASACFATAKELEKGGHAEGAIPLYEKARESDPKLGAQVCRRLAILYDRQGEYQKANGEYEKALAQSPKDAELLNNIGYSYYCRGQLVEAETYLRRAVAASPHHSRAWNNMGMVLAMQGKNDESLQAFQKAVSPALAHCNLAFVMAAQGTVNDAKRHYQKALELDPSQALAKTALTKLTDPNFGKVQQTAGSTAASANGVPAASAPKAEKPAKPAALPLDPITIDPR